MIRVNNQLVLLNGESRINVTATFGTDARLVQCLPDGSTLLVPLRPDGMCDVALPDQARFILTTVGQSSTYDPIALQSMKLQLDALSLRVATIERATPVAVESPMMRPSSPIANKPSAISTNVATPPRKIATVCEHCRERPVSAVVTQDGATVSLCKPCGLALQQRLEAGRVTLKVVQKAATLGPGGELPNTSAQSAAVAPAAPSPVPRPTAVDRPSSPGLTSPRRIAAGDIRKPTHAPARPPAARIDGGASRSRPPGVDDEPLLARLPPKPLPMPRPSVVVAREEDPTPPLPEVDIDVEDLPVVDLSQFGTSARVIDEATTTTTTTTAAAVELPNQPSTLNHDAARNRTKRAGSVVIVNGVPQHDPVHGHPPKPRRPVRGGAAVAPNDEDINGADFPLISADEYDEPLPEPPSEADNEPPAAAQPQSSVGDSEREPPPPPPPNDDDEQQVIVDESLVRESTTQEAMPRESMPREPMHTFRDKTELNSILTIGLGRDPRAGMVKGVMKVAMSPRPTSPPPALMRTTSPTRPLSPVAGDAPPPQPPQPHVSIRPEAPATRPSVSTGRSMRSIATPSEQLAPVFGVAVLEGELTIRETARTWKSQFIRVVPPYLYVFEDERAAVPRARLALTGATVDEFQTAKISHTLMVRNTTTSWLLGCGDESAQRRWQSQLRAVAAQSQ
jgi:hypothetical protein